MRIDWHCVCGDSEPAHTSRSDGERCNGWCQKTERDCNGMGYRPIPHVLRPAAFAAILAEAERRYLPKFFTCDLSTDYQSLIGQGGLLLPDGGYHGRFIWLLRESGTEFYRLDDQQPQDYLHSKVGMDYWTDPKQGHQDTLIFLWDGDELHEITREAGLTMLNMAVVRTESHNCHGANWHDHSCTHRRRSIAPDGTHMHRAGVMACSLCAPEEVIAQ